MKILLFTLAAVAVLFAAGTAIAARPKWHELTADYSYDQYLTDLSKPRPVGNEYEMRRDLFQRRLLEILQHNADKTQLWQKGVGPFTDRTDAERKRLRGYKPQSAETMARLRAQPHVKKHELVVKQGPGPATIPSSFDWRDRLPNVITAVKNQGFCGDCWGNAAVAALESHYALSSGLLFALSIQQVTACAPNPNDCGGTGGCQGSIAELAFDYVIKGGGIAEEYTYPFTSYSGQTGKCYTGTAAPPGPMVAKFDGYVEVKSNDQDHFINALFYSGPLAINVDASDWSDYENGIFNGCHYSKNISIDHVVNAVGQGVDYVDGKAVPYIWVRNSWSPAWGDLAGYIKLLKTNDCGLNVHAQDGTACKGAPTTQHTCGMCGYLFSTSYPYVSTTKK